jgi:hypothetical protein
MSTQGTIPVIKVEGDGLPEAWERAICHLLAEGADAPTQYDRPGDPPSKDAMVVIEINQPMLEPRIHAFFPGGPTDLEEYCQEVIAGIKDHWVRDPNDPEDKRWSYTYHGRMCEDFGVDQIAGIVDKLTKQPFTRQAQFTTWMPASDPQDYDPPCLQRGWARILRNVETKRLEFHGHVYMRSWDALKAGFMNLFAFIRMFDEHIRRPVEAALNEDEPILFKRFVAVGDSFHIYGKDFKDLEAFRACVGKRYFYDLPSEPWHNMMADARNEIAAKVKAQDKARKERGE